MKKSTLLTLATLAAIIVIAAIMTTSKRGSFETASPAKGIFYPEFSEKRANVNKVILTSPSRTLSFEKRENMWVATHKHDHPANARLIQKTLETLAKMKKTQEKTKKPEGYQKLGVEDKLSSTSRGFIFEGLEGDTSLIHTHIGARASTGKDEFYVRNHGDEQVWQVRGDLSLKDDDETWLSSEIINLDKKRIMSVDFIDDQSNKFSIMRENAKETSFDLKPLPQGRKIKSPYIIDVASKGLTKMVLNDVRPLSDFTMSQSPFATYRTFDGLVVQLYYAEKPKQGTKTLGLAKKGWITLRTSVNEKQLSKGKGDKDEIVAEANKLASRHGKWAYHIPSYKLEQIKRSLESLLDPVEEKKKKGKKVS